MRSTSKLRWIPITKVLPGQEFIHYGIAYVRATEQEERKHPSRELDRNPNRPLVFGYTVEGERTPVSFVPELKVNVAI